ncbi:MAG TPA: zinc transporter ZupT, partial [Gemmiger qucibialis]|nr:zinc transporter ZupT [Gemmiger qucibialis]
EGLAVAVPFACATGSRAKGAVAALVSGLAEPAGAVLAALVLAPLLTPGLLNGIVAVVAGIMLWVAAAQLLPAAFEPAWRKMGVTGFCAGVLMMILGIAALA